MLTERTLRLDHALSCLHLRLEIFHVIINRFIAAVKVGMYSLCHANVRRKAAFDMIKE